MKPKKINWRRTTSIMVACMFISAFSLYLIMLIEMLFEYFYKGKVSNAEQDFFLCSKLVLMSGLVSGVGCCFLKDDEFKKK